MRPRRFQRGKGEWDYDFFVGGKKYVSLVTGIFIDNWEKEEVKAKKQRSILISCGEKKYVSYGRGDAIR